MNPIRQNPRGAAAALAISVIIGGAIPAAAFAQSVSGGTSGGVAGEGVSASTYGSGQQTTNPDGSATGIQGGGEATAVDGSATTRSDAKLNERRAMQRSTASARDEDERARSRTRTTVREGEVRSRTMSIYKERGEKPEREMTHSVTTPEGTTTRTK